MVKYTGATLIVGAAGAVIALVWAVRRLFKSTRSHVELTPVSDQWLADHKRDSGQSL
jgi:hypothetical protein